MASIDGKYLDEDGFSLYKTLLGHYIYLHKGYANNGQIDGLFDEEPLVSIPPFKTATDQQITDIINGYYDGVYTLEQIQSAWHVGDTRDIDINAIPAVGDNWSVGESHRAQTVTIQILDFDREGIDGGHEGTADRDKALLVVGLKDCLSDATVENYHGEDNTELGYMNSTATSTLTWDDCAREKWCKHGFYGALPAYIQSLIKTIQLPILKHDGVYSIFSTGTVFLLDKHNVSSANSYAYYSDTTDYFKKPRYSNNSSRWWLRSVGNDTTSFHSIYAGANEEIIQTSANTPLGLAPAWCM